MNPHHPCFHNCHPAGEIPEPSTWLLILIAAALYCAWTWWRRKGGRA